MKRTLVLLALPILFLASCKSGPTAEEQKAALEKTVLEVHDEAMVKMGTIHQLRRQLQHLRDSLQKQETDTTTVNILQKQVLNLNRADEAMMGWMHQYKAPDSLQHESAMQYLQEQKVKIEDVLKQMDSSIYDARKLTKRYEIK